MDASRSKKVEMLEVKTNRKNAGKQWYRVRVIVKSRRIFITSALRTLLDNATQVVFAHHPEKLKDWYIRNVEEKETGIPVKVEEHGGGMIGGAQVIRELEDSLDIVFTENTTIMVSKHPEIINNLKYYPLITKALEHEGNSK